MGGGRRQMAGGLRGSSSLEVMIEAHEPASTNPNFKLFILYDMHMVLY